MQKELLITLAIHTYDHALSLKNRLETNGIAVKLQNVNLSHPIVSSGVRVRIAEKDLPLALKIVENGVAFDSPETNLSDNSKILIPVDFSDYSITACKAGFRIAQQMNLHPVLLNTFITPYFDGSLPISDNLSADLRDNVVRKDLQRKAETQMRLFKERLAGLVDSDELPDVKFSTIVKEGVPEEVILEYSRTAVPALIVMATRGMSKKKEELIGSVTAEVLDSCRVPVFTVPEGCNVDELNDTFRVAYFCNLNHDDMISMDTLMRLFSLKGCEIDVVPVNERAGTKIYERVKRLISYFESHYSENKFHSVILSHKSFRNDIESIIDNHGISLLVVPNKKTNIFSRLFNPSIAHKILFEHDIPMLVLPI